MAIQINPLPEFDTMPPGHRRILKAYKRIVPVHSFEKIVNLIADDTVYSQRHVYRVLRIYGFSTQPTRLKNFDI